MLTINKNKKNLFSYLVIAAVGLFLAIAAERGFSLIKALAVSTDLPASGHVVETRILNVPGESILLKTYDSKYVLIDTGSNNQGSTAQVIYDALVKAQGETSVVIDYLIISHLDADHYGSAKLLLRADNEIGKNITVNNLIIKYEKEYKPNVYRNIVAAAVLGNSKINILTSSNVVTDINNGNMMALFGNNSTTLYERFVDRYAILRRDESIAIGEYLNLYFYNVEDVFTNETCTTGKMLHWTANSNDANLARYNADGTLNMKSGEYYLYFDGSNYPNSSYRLVKPKPTQKGNDNNNLMNKYWYAKIPNIDNLNSEDNLRSTCKSNINSYGVLAEVKNKSENNKYMYFANDLENGGYGVIPRNGIYGNDAGELYSTYNVNVNNGKVTFNYISNRNEDAYYETKVARSIYNRLTNNGVDESALSNLVIYQGSHHGKNNAPDAINRLQLNRSSVYAISASQSALSPTSNSFLIRRSQDFALSNVPASRKLYSGGSTDGVSCAIGVSGSYTCGYIKVRYVYKSLNYDLNGGNGTVNSSKCALSNIGVGEAYCQMVVTDEIPTKSGYTFKGWSENATATEAQYFGNDSLNVNNNKTLYAVYVQNPTYRLTYNLNSGSGNFEEGSCVVDDENQSCSVTISSEKPIKPGYLFLGWADRADATSATMNSGSSVVLSGNKVIYAVWEEIPSGSSKFILSYNLNGGMGALQNTSCETATSSCNVRISSIVPERDGYRFLGWADRADATSVTMNPDDNLLLVENRTIYAVWSENPLKTMVLSYDLNGGTGEFLDTTCSTRDTECQVVIVDKQPVKNNYYFLGWSSSATGSIVEYLPGDSVTLSNNKTIYAVWEMDREAPEESGDPEEPDEKDEPDGSDESEEGEGENSQDGGEQGTIPVPNTGDFSYQEKSSNEWPVVGIMWVVLMLVVVVARKARNKKVYKKFD